MSIRRLGTNPHLGETVELCLPTGVCARIVSRGGCVTSLLVPDKNGTLADVVLGYGNDADYVVNPVFFGTLIGRFGNRIARGELVLDGQKYSLPINNGANSIARDSNGTPVRLGSLWATKPAVVVFLRHYG